MGTQAVGPSPNPAVNYLQVVEIDPVTGYPVSTGGGGGGANPNSNPATISSQQLTASTSAQPFAAQAGVNGFVVQNDPTSGINVFVGPSGVTTATGYLLVPGDKISYGVQNASAIYVIAASGTPKVYLTGN